MAPLAGTAPQRQINDWFHSANSAVASLGNNRLLVVWQTYQQDGSIDGVAGRLVWVGGDDPSTGA